MMGNDDEDDKSVQSIASDKSVEIGSLCNNETLDIVYDDDDDFDIFHDNDVDGVMDMDDERPWKMYLRQKGTESICKKYAVKTVTPIYYGKRYKNVLSSGSSFG
jgi:hypothetical protein